VVVGIEDDESERMCVRVCGSQKKMRWTSECARACVRVCVCVCVCGCSEGQAISERESVCVWGGESEGQAIEERERECVCVCKRKRVGRQVVTGEEDEMSERERECVCVCVCV